MMEKIRNILLPVGIIFTIILLFSHGIFHTFFEQDEWGALGSAIYSFTQPWWKIFVSRGYHFSPIGYLLWDALYLTFGLQAQYYALIQLFMHAVAVYLVYVLSKRLTVNSRVAVVTAVLFAVNGRADQAYLHLAINTTVAAYVFILLFFVYLTSITRKLFSVRDILVLFAIFLISVSIREEGVMLIPLFAAYIVIFDRKKINRQNIKSVSYLCVGFGLFFVLRYISQRMNTVTIPAGLHPTFGSFLYNLISLPVKFVVQNIVSGVSIFRTLLQYGMKIYPDMNASVLSAYPVFMDLAFTGIFCILCVIFTAWILQAHNGKPGRIVVFSMIWIFCNAILLALARQRLYIVEERYLYVSSFPVLLCITMVMESLFNFRSRRYAVVIAGKIIAAGAVILLLLTSYQQIQATVQYKIRHGEARRHLLESILAVHPVIPDNTILYFRCRVSCHGNEAFGLQSRWVLPFPSGPGWNLLVLYSGRQPDIWSKFLTDDFLLGLDSQGYKRIGNDGFGYFIDVDLLRKTLSDTKQSSDIVIALEYDEKTFSVRDISETFRKELDEKHAVGLYN